MIHHPPRCILHQHERWKTDLIDDLLIDCTHLRGCEDGKHYLALQIKSASHAGAFRQLWNWKKSLGEIGQDLGQDTKDKQKRGCDDQCCPRTACADNTDRTGAA